MKVYETITCQELQEKFQPIKVKLLPWHYPTSIKTIRSRITSETGRVSYIVEFKGGQVEKIPYSNFDGANKKLIEDFELHQFCQQDAGTRKRLHVFQSQPEPKKKVRFQLENDDTSSATVSSEEYDSEEEQADESEFEDTEMSTVSRSGRVVKRSQSFGSEFYSSSSSFLGRKSQIEYTCRAPIPTDQTIIQYHCSRCYRCHKPGIYNGKLDVPIGPKSKRCRLLFCRTCSCVIHNNCLPSLSNSYFDNGELTCIKCQKNTKCSQCCMSIVDKSNIIPFRCYICFRAFHKNCIKPGVSSSLADETDDLDLIEFYNNGKCIECITFGSVPGSIVGERVVNNKKECLIKWKNFSYRHTNWVSESWMQGAQPSAHRAYIKKRQENPTIATNGIPVEWTIVDRILNVEWENMAQRVPRRILAVYKDTSYEDAVWDSPPEEQDTELYPDYKLALERYIQSTQVKPPIGVKKLISEVRKLAKTESYEKHELKFQPDFIKGGTLMKHQLEALNWLLYQWENKQSCILADDMGLGKTIQIISYLYTLYVKYNIYPFIIVVPNSTATNWIREFNKWAPELTTAPYFGGSTGRKLALENEIFDSRMNLKCHVVVTTYESSMEASKLQHIFWPVMVVDESQRLKNDESLLFRTLKKYNIDQITLLTGTPLQNNLKELFNIMNFIQPKGFHGSEAENYTDMTRVKVADLHTRLRPHFLRRTKEEVLKTLPPKYELIVPVSMTPIQKEVYKQCLSREIFETLRLATGSKVQKGLSSIFVNLRKILNHPYLLDGVEAAQPTPDETQNAMIDACGKLILFHQMLPKLKAKGHRVLLFSTMTRTLDVLEDYMTYQNIKYCRLDGSCSERNRVRSIDAFNAPNSQIDVFLLSTRAGGVGINLASADTIIIWDSDFNPYADLQAISRAHRIGQNNMVLILRLMTRLTVEEKVLQIGKRKMALEHVVVERMNENEEEKIEDFESILKFGAEALFADDDSKDIHYDSAAIDNLLDREKYREVALEKQKEEIQEAEKGNAKAAEQGVNFSFAKVWKVDGSIDEFPSDVDDTGEGNTSEDFWQKFLKQRELEAARKKEEKRLAAENLGRGARKRAVVTYSENLKEITKSKKLEEQDDIFVFEDPHGASSDDEADEKLKVNPLQQQKQQVVPPISAMINWDSTQPVQLAQPIQPSRPIQPLRPIQPVQHATDASYILTDSYKELLFSEIFQVAIPYMQKNKAIFSKAFHENFHETSTFRAMSEQLYQELFSVLDGHFRMLFMDQYNRSKQDIHDSNLPDDILQAQLDLLKSHLSFLGSYIEKDVLSHYMELQETRKESTVNKTRVSLVPSNQVMMSQIQGEANKRASEDSLQRQLDQQRIQQEYNQARELKVRKQAEIQHQDTLKIRQAQLDARQAELQSRNFQFRPSFTNQPPPQTPCMLQYEARQANISTVQKQQQDQLFAHQTMIRNQEQANISSRSPSNYQSNIDPLPVAHSQSQRQAQADIRIRSDHETQMEAQRLSYAGTPQKQNNLIHQAINQQLDNQKAQTIQDKQQALLNQQELQRQRQGQQLQEQRESERQQVLKQVLREAHLEKELKQQAQVQAQEQLQRAQAQAIAQRQTQIQGPQRAISPAPLSHAQLSPEMVLKLRAYLAEHAGQGINLQDGLAKFIAQALQVPESKERPEAKLLRQQQQQQQQHHRHQQQHSNHHQQQHNNHQQQQLQRQQHQQLREEEEATRKRRQEVEEESQRLREMQQHLLAQDSGSGSRRSPPQLGYVNPAQLSRQNTEYFRNISPDVLKSLFSAPPSFTDTNNKGL